MEECPCGTGKDYKECCKPYHLEEKWPANAEALMRSRYSAYVVKEIDYIAKTHSPKAPTKIDLDATKQWAQDSEWMGLKIIKVEENPENNKRSNIEFIASYNLKGNSCEHHELAEFEKINDKWFFHDGSIVGQQPIKRAAPKIGRNDPCHCGSGKKFKKCCG